MLMRGWTVYFMPRENGSLSLLATPRAVYYLVNGYYNSAPQDTRGVLSESFSFTAAYGYSVRVGIFILEKNLMVKY